MHTHAKFMGYYTKKFSILTWAKHMRLIRIGKAVPAFCVAALVATLFACSGGDSGSTATSTGKFSDASGVAGIQYQTASQSGLTGVGGEFTYKAGESVTFSVGDIVIGQAPAAANLTTFDLVGIAPPLSALGIPNNTPSSLLFQQAANISVFLQTVDATNGILIPPKLNAIAVGKSINFKQNYLAFEKNFNFRQLMGEARAAGVWGGTRPIKMTYKAVNDLYRGQKLTAVIYNKSTMQMDTTSVNTNYAYEYDNSGALTKSSNFVTGGNGFGYSKNIYDQSGRLIKTESYDQNDTLIKYTARTYDGNGYLTGSSSYGNNGVLKKRTAYAYDSYGNNTIYEEYDPISNTVNKKVVSTYDAKGNAVKQSQYDLGVLSLYFVMTYNANNQMTQAITYDAAGTRSEKRVNTYDANGNLMKYVVTSGNGDVIKTVQFTYDVNKNQLTSKTFDPNGALTSSLTNTYDGNGFKTSVSSSYESGAKQWSSASLYNAKGNLVSVKGTLENTTKTFGYIQTSVWGSILQ